MEKKFQFFRKLLLLTLLMLGVGSAFGYTIVPEPFDCSAGATWGGYTLEPATKVNNIYEINTPGKLAWFSCYVNNKHDGSVSDKAKLTADIKMNSDDANEADKKYWIPICAGTGGKAADSVVYCKYSGIFDGNDHKISNLYLNSDFLEQMNVYYTQNVGFIGAFTGKVTNLTLENIQVLGSGDGGKYVSGGDCVTRPVSIGTLVGWSSGTVEDCIVSGTIVTSGVGQAVGGLVGNAGGGFIKGSVSEVTIDASGLAYAGGVVGYTKNTVSIESCVYAGGGVSSTGSAKVGDKTYESAAGGVVGRQFPKSNVTAENVYYDDSSVEGAVGNGSLNQSSTAYGSSDVNQEEVACVLNKGKWKAETETCEDAESDKWSVGFMGLSYEGSDGYMVTFDANGGGFPSGAKKYNVVISGTTITANGISIPSRDGYAFVGWSRNKNATTPDEDLGEVNGQTTVYAVWNPMIEITFNANGGYFPPDPSTTTKTKLVPTGDPITVEGIEPLPEKYCTGSVNGEECVGGVWMYFRGWSFNDEASVNEAIDLNQLTTYASSENTTLYAIWTTTETYTVTFHAEGHGKTKVAFTGTEVEVGGYVNEPADDFAVPDNGYEFDGWWTEKNGGTQFDFEKTPITHSIILHAHWKATDYIITCVNAPCDADPLTYTIESDFPFYTPTQTGYTFDGWFYDEQFSTKAEGIKPGATGPLTIYAKWSEATYTITYRAGTYGNGEVLPETVNHGVSYTLKGASYTRDGYVQDGWTTTEDGAKNYELGGIYSANADVTLYPHWANNLEITSIGAVRIYDYGDHKEAVIDGAYTGEGVIDIPEDITVSSVVFNRAFTPNTMSTLMLPFSIDVSKVKGGQIYRFKYVEMDEKTGDPKTVHIGRIKTTTVGANTPYLVLPTAETMTFEGPVTLNTTTSPLENAHGTTENDFRWEFKGVYAHTNLGSVDIDYTKYAFAGQPKVGIHVGKFVELGTNANSYPMRAYLVDLESYTEAEESLNKYAGGRNYSRVISNFIDVEIEDENGVVASGKLNTITGEFRMDCWFDLKGRKYNSKPSVKGTYYKNGKKVIIK